MYWPHIRRTCILRLNVFLLLALFSTLAVAQDQAPDREKNQPTAPEQTVRRPRIGLALSGGGAIGLAEIGVIQWLEQNHIPIDRIAGTSMGSIIAAMYATGMSPTEIEKFAEGIDWDSALLPAPSYRQLGYRRKQDRRDYQIEPALGLKHGLNGPNGINPGHGVGLLLDRIAFPESGIASFDDLPIPFRCVATDMQTGDRVVLHDGSLPRAVRASIAIPGVFTPVEINGRVLADGGMVENIPVEVVREMDADTVIAVYLRLPLGKREQLESLTGVLSRALDVMLLQNERRSLALANTTITVDTGNFSIDDYDRLSDLIQLGYQSAASQAAALLPFAIQDDTEWQQYLAARSARKSVQPTQVHSVVVEGGDSDTNRRLEQTLKSDTRSPLNLPKLEAQLTRIAGEGEFDRLGYEGFTQDGVPALRVTAHEKTYGPPFVDLAVNVDGSGVAAFDFSAGTRITFMDVEHHGGEWRNDLLLGSSNLAASEFYQPLGNTHLFVAPYAFASKLPRNEFTGGTRVAVFGDERAGGGFDFGFNTGQRSEFRVGDTRSSAASWRLSSVARACRPSVAVPENSARATSGTGRIAPRFPVAARASSQTFPEYCRAPVSLIPSGNSTFKLPPSFRLGRRHRSFLSRTEEQLSTAPPVHSNSLRSAERSTWALTFRRNSSATTMPTLQWDSAARFITCRSLSEERSTGADGMKPVRPSTIRERL